MSRVEDLLAEGESVPVEGWDFSWFAGREAGSAHPRATEGRPPWGYARLLGRRLAALAGVPGAVALDLQTGGGEVLAAAASNGLPNGLPADPAVGLLTNPAAGLAAPPALVATESWPPNMVVAERHLAPLGARVVAVPGPDSDLPFPDAAFDLVTSRHPVRVRWDEVARVLKPGGSYFSQDVGHPSVGELTEYMMGPRPAAAPDQPNRDPKWSVLSAEQAGLAVTDLREYHGRMEFYDVAAVVVFLRKVIWIVPGFTVAGYRDRLRALHEQIERDGSFVATTVRFLIEARKLSPAAGKGFPRPVPVL
ncbi:MAG TPA: methyltransferase domain-containing protein [Streptosporangiaceae bacterium]